MVRRDLIVTKLSCIVFFGQRYSRLATSGSAVAVRQLSNSAASGRRRVERVWYMARNVPLRQLLRRLELRLHAPFIARLSRSLTDRASPNLAATLPMPLFAPRRMQAESREEGFRLVLPWGARDFAIPLDWHAARSEPVEQSWCTRLHYMEFLEGLETPLFERVVLDWIARNPLDSPRALRFAWQPFALSIRVVVWMQEITRRQREFSHGFIAPTVAALAAQLRFIERRLETDVRGNHLIKNIKALLWASAFFSSSESTRWQRQAISLLKTELAEQVLEDGTHYERSPTYHCQVMADLLECYAILPSGPLKAELAVTLARMARAATLLTHPDGDIAQFNDCGLRNAYASGECLAVFEQQLHRHETAEEGAFALPDAGFFGYRQGGDHLIVDCGEVAPASLIAHGHGDILSFEWSVDGNRIVVDQGAYQYSAGPRREATRSTLNHNTVSIDGEEQCDFYGAHRCGRRARPRLLQWRPSATGFLLTGSHNGFAHLPGSPEHVRCYDFAPEKLTITDRLSRCKRRTAQAAYLFHPDCRIELTGPQSALVSRKHIRMSVTAPGPLHLEEAEWYPDLYVALPTKRLRIDLRTDDTELLTVFDVQAANRYGFA